MLPPLRRRRQSHPTCLELCAKKPQAGVASYVCGCGNDGGEWCQHDVELKNNADVVTHIHIHTDCGMTCFPSPLCLWYACKTIHLKLMCVGVRTCFAPYHCTLRPAAARGGETASPGRRAHAGQCFLVAGIKPGWPAHARSKREGADQREINIEQISRPRGKRRRTLAGPGRQIPAR